MTCRHISTLAVSAVVFATLIAGASWAHSGRRFEVGAPSGKLVAQGVNTGANDGAPGIRPYQNVIHDHWQNSPLGFDSALATLPGFDVPSPVGLLVNQPLYLTLQSVNKWENPPLMPNASTIPQLSSLQPDELLELRIGTQETDSDQLGTLVLSSLVPSSGLLDLDVSYEINSRPENAIYILSTLLSSGSSAVETSDPVYIILSPDGTNHAERLHHASLFLEEYLAASATPEPSTLAILFSSTLLAGRWRPQRSC